jgi:hypothetical protein
MDQNQSLYGKIVPDKIFEDIWDYLYKVRVPYLSTMSEEYIKQFGVPSSGDKKIDKEQMNQLITTYMTIEKMVSLFKEGVPIRLVEPDAPKKIYESTSKYLDYCRNMLERQINISDAPLEDLIAMDLFASSVYEHAKYHMVASSHTSPLAMALNRYSGFKLKNDRLSMLPSSQNDTSSINPSIVSESINDIPQRESLADLFKKQMSNQYFSRSL